MSSGTIRGVRKRKDHKHTGTPEEDPREGETAAWLTRREAAALARMSTRTIDRWLHDPTVNLSLYRPREGSASRVLIRRQELLNLLAVRRSNFERRRS